MPYSDAELERLYGDLAPTNPVDTATPEAEVPDPLLQDIPYKRIKQIANIIPKAIGSTAASVNAILSPDDPALIKQSEDFLPTFNVGENKGITDVALNQVAPAIAAWTIPYLGATKLGRIAGLANDTRLGAGLLEALGQGSANAFTSVAQPDSNPAESGALGAASGFFQATLPRWQRALPLAAVSAAHVVAGGSLFEAGANLVGNLLPGAHSVTVPQLNAKPLQEIADSLLPHSPSIDYSDFAPSQTEGTFNFMNKVPENAPLGTNDIAGNVPPPIFQHTTLDQLNGLQLARDPVQMDLSLNTSESPSDLQLNHSFPTEIEAPPTIPTNDASLRLEGQSMQQPDLHPLLTLQGETLDPTANFKLINGLEDAKIPTQDHPELGDWRNNEVNRPRPLLLEDTKPQVELPKAEVPSSPVEPPPTPPKPKGKIESPPEPEPTVKETPHDKALSKLDNIELDPEAKKSQVISHAKKLVKDGTIKQADLEEIQRISKDRDMGVDDVASELRSSIEASRPKETPKVEAPQVMTPTGDFMDVQPKMQGPHVISTVLDEGDGQYLAGANWKDLHMEGGNSIFSQNIETASGVGKSAFLIKDETGAIRVTQDRMEAAKIAEMAGQRSNDTVGNGALQSQHLVEPTPGAPKTPIATVAAEKATDAKVLASAKKNIELVDKLQRDLQFAKEEGDDLAVRGISKALQKLRAQQGFATEAGLKTSLILTAGGVAGLVEYQRSKGDIGDSIAAGLVVAGLALAGAKAFTELKGKVGPEAKVNIKAAAESIAKGNIKQFAIATSHTPAGLAVGGRAGVWAQSNNLIEGLLGLNQTEALKSAKVFADGFLAARAEELTRALEAVKGYKPTAAFQQAENLFIRGQLADKVKIQDILNSGNSVTGETYAKMSRANKANFPEKWMVLDDPHNTNTKGDGIEVWYVSNTTKQKLVQAQVDALDSFAANPTDKAYSVFPKAFREITDNVMRVYHDALPEGSNKNRLAGTTGQYIARSHEVITNPNAYPTEVEIQNAMDRLGILHEKDFLSSVDATQAPTPINNTAINWGGNTYYVKASDALDFKYLHSPESLHGEVRDYIKEIKNRAALKNLGAIDPDSEQFSNSLFTGRKELDVVTQALLGTHEAPYALMRSTLNKVLPAGQSAIFIKEASQAIDNLTGLKSSLNSTEYNRAIEEARIAMSKGDVAAKNKYNELLSYTKSGENDKFGLTSDMFISRGLKEKLQGFDGTPFTFLDNAIGRGLHNFNSFFKTTHLALSPATIARQIVQAPLMMAMGGVRDIESIINGFGAYMDRSTPLGKWMNESGVFSASAKHGDFNDSLSDVLSGQTDKNLWAQIKRGVAKAHTLFAAPDDIVRASVFLNEAKRAAAELKVPLDSFDPRVTARAQAFMLRRAMDFSNLPKYVKIGREVPFVNIFLAYTHEILRVSKNMAIDAGKGDLQAGATLAGMTTLPFLLQKEAESNLSPKDLADWQKASNLAPAYSRPRFKIPLGRNANGSFNYLDITSVLPFSDYQMMARSILHGDAESFANVNPLVGLDKAPFFNVMAPQIAGKDLHTDRDFRGIEDRTKNFVKQLLPGWTPGIGGEYEKSVPEALGGDLGVTNLKNGRTNTSIGTFLRNVLGIDFTQIDANIVTRNFVRSAQHDIANERQYMMDVMKQDGISVDAKKRASEKFTEAVQQITSQLQARLQLQPKTN